MSGLADDYSRRGAEHRAHAFCFILLATKYKGATGCPVRPAALVQVL